MRLWSFVLFALSYQFKKLHLNYKPFVFWIEPTNYCNLKCVSCPQSIEHSGVKGYMEMGVYKRILDEMKSFSPVMVSLHLGGESLLHKDLPEMIRLAKENSVKVTLASNATLLTKKKSIEIIEAGIDGITVNFSSDKDEFEKYCKGAKWEKVYQNIRDFLTIKKKIGKPEPSFSIQVLDMSYKDDKAINKEIKKLEHLFLGLPFNSIVSVSPHSWSGKFADQLTGKIEFLKDKNRYFPCSHLWSSMVVCWNGNIVPCCRDLQGEMVLGNVNNTSLADIWNGEKFVELRKKHREFKYDEIPICKNCSKPWEGVKPYHILFNNIMRVFGRTLPVQKQVFIRRKGDSDYVAQKRILIKY